MEEGFDIERLRLDAHSRWLKPLEVFFILKNHEKYLIAEKTPHKPPSGSLLLFNRRVNRFFRKDGYTWRKKKDGRMGEGHERLKVGSIDSLNCYYAHGESNPSFQRRSYWMLNTSFEHIVLVHYREVFEGKCISGSNVSLPSSSFSENIVSVGCQNADLNDENSQTCMPYQFSRRRGYNVVDSELLASNDYLGHLELDNESGSSIISSEPNVNAEIRKLKLYLLDDEENEHIPLQPASDCNVQRSEPTTPWKDILHSYTVESVYKNGRVSEALTFGDHEFPTASEHIFEEMFSINDTNYPQNDAQLFSMVNGSKQPGRSKNYGENEISNFLHLESNPEQLFPEEYEHFCLGTTTTMPGNEDDKRAVSLKDSAPYSSDFSTRQSYENSKHSCFREKPTLSNKLIFHIREVCPEWAFSTDHTKICSLSKCLVLNQLVCLGSLYQAQCSIVNLFFR